MGGKVGGWEKILNLLEVEIGVEHGNIKACKRGGQGAFSLKLKQTQNSRIGVKVAAALENENYPKNEDDLKNLYNL